MNLKRCISILIFSASILLATACAGRDPVQSGPDESTESNANMANPAAVYCSGLGYKMETVTRNGGEDADCIFPDESRCGQWDFLSGRCGQESSYCSQQGYKILEGTNIGACQFPDGSTCDEFLFFTGDCSPGDNLPSVIEEDPVQPGPDESTERIANMANPAAVYCSGLGYAMETVTRNGGEDADCIFPDESRCGQWDFLSGRCGQESSYCSQQGYKILEGTNIGACQFPDGSTCDEFLFFTGDCSPGDNLPSVIEEDLVKILGFDEARDFIASYFSGQYGIKRTEPWMEQNITPQDAVGSSTVRFVSGPLTIVIFAEAAAPSPSEYVIKEASYIVNGFYWEGTLSFEGEITETKVHLPGTILNEENARDEVMEHLIVNYDLPTYGEWIDQGFTPTESVSMKRVYTSEAWVVTIEFEPSAPLVSTYFVTVDNLTESIRWEGDITLRGEISETSFKIQE